jgi:3-oxoacyl-[acyl-carrier protein] reductase
MTTQAPGSRTAIVTGGSRGIGRQCVERLAADGLSVVVSYAGNDAEANAAVTAAETAGAKAFAVKGDVADEVAMAALFDQAEEAFGGIDVVVHAAGRMILAPLVDFDLAVIDSLHRTNVRGTFVIDQLAARRLRDAGSVVNFSTSVVGTHFPTYSAYAATKGAVEAITLILAKELRGRDVTVNAVAPGPTATALFLDGKDEEAIKRLANAVPLDRLGTPADIAEVVAFLTSPAGRWINGQNIRVNGGLV